METYNTIYENYQYEYRNRKSNIGVKPSIKSI